MNFSQPLFIFSKGMLSEINSISILQINPEIPELILVGCFYVLVTFMKSMLFCVGNVFVQEYNGISGTYM